MRFSTVQSDFMLLHYVAHVITKTNMYTLCFRMYCTYTHCNIVPVHIIMTTHEGSDVAQAGLVVITLSSGLCSILLLISVQQLIMT